LWCTEPAFFTVRLIVVFAGNVYVVWLNWKSRASRLIDSPPLAVLEEPHAPRAIAIPPPIKMQANLETISFALLFDAVDPPLILIRAAVTPC
jgi:hypothetical protein